MFDPCITRRLVAHKSNNWHERVLIENRLCFKGCQLKIEPEPSLGLPLLVPFAVGQDDRSGVYPDLRSSCRTPVPCNPALLKLLASRRVLMLQGPVGPFFDRLALWLKGHGVQVQRVVFQGGDEYDCRALQPIPYLGSASDWPSACIRLLQAHEIDCIVLFGQVRTYHAAAIEVARTLGVGVVVLEEGYFRPGYVTIELDGVNAHSTTLERRVWSADALGPQVKLSPPDHSNHQFQRFVARATAHYLAMRKGRAHYPNAVHHRPASLRHYIRYAALSWSRKAIHYWPDHARVRSLAKQRYYFVPLQYDGDAQITHHSRFRVNPRFISELLQSFADHAPADTQLVLRQHPWSRGEHSHSAFIRSLALQLKIAHRLVFLVEGHTPTLVRNSLGVVLINSTVGLQALEHMRPLKVLGQAVYERPDICFPGSLDAFWTLLPQPDPAVVNDFLLQLRNLTQLPCNVYGARNEPLYWSLSDDSGGHR